MARRTIVASMCGAIAIGLTSACGASTSDKTPTETPQAQKTTASTPSSTPTPSTSPTPAAASKAPVTTPGPVNRPNAEVSNLIAGLTPAQFALNKAGYLLITYADDVNGIKEAWRLYGPGDNVTAEGRRGGGPTAVDNGFLLFGRRAKFLDRRGRLTKVTNARVLAPPSGCRWTPPSPASRKHSTSETRNSSPGTASPDGAVTLIDGKGRYWALGEHTPGRTVVRLARPGGAWRSRDLGPRIGAQRVTGAGNLIMVTGVRRMYLTRMAARRGACCDMAPPCTQGKPPSSRPTPTAASWPEMNVPGGASPMT